MTLQSIGWSFASHADGSLAGKDSSSPHLLVGHDGDPRTPPARGRCHPSHRRAPIDLSDWPRSVGERDDLFSTRHGRGDEAKIGTRDRLHDGSKEIVDAPAAGASEQRTEMPAIRVATRDFH
jgi:hypothetical protein